MSYGTPDQITMVASTVASALLVMAIGLTIRARRLAKLTRQTVRVSVESVPSY